MKKLLSLLPALLVICFLVSCTEEDLDDFIKKSGNSNLSQSEIIDGLKTALTTGTDSSTSVLSKANGYYKDALVKILLPSEINNAISSFKSKTFSYGSIINVSGQTIYESGFSALNIASLKDKEDELILGINRAAEAAAQSAGPIFKDAIVQMSFDDARSILTGADTAATSYLRGKTYDNLFREYNPVISQALNSVKVGNVSVAEAYKNYISQYNSMINTKIDPTSAFTTKTLGSLVEGVNTVQVVDLSNYSTKKGLNGLFLKVSDEEQKIRFNPFAYVSEILQKVFGNSSDE